MTAHNYRIAHDVAERPETFFGSQAGGGDGLEMLGLTAMVFFADTLKSIVFSVSSLIGRLFRVSHRPPFPPRKPIPSLAFSMRSRSFRRADSSRVEDRVTAVAARVGGIGSQA